jgi:hypothetical protein
MILEIRAAALATIVAVGIAPVALADTQPAEPEAASPHWQQDPDRIWFVDGADAGHGADYYSFARMIRSSGGDGPITILNCHATSTGQNSLSLGFQIDPDNAYEDAPDHSPRILTASGILTVGGKKQAERFRYHADSTKIIPFDPAVPRRVFNAVVTGEEVTLKFQGKTYDLGLPGKDKVFVSFAKTCPVTNGGKFDYSIFDQAPDIEMKMK